MTLPIQERTQCMHGARLDQHCSQCGDKSAAERREMPSDELDGLKLGTPEEERAMAKRWMDAASQMSRDANYWRGVAAAWENRANALTRPVFLRNGSIEPAPVRNVSHAAEPHGRCGPPESRR